MSTNAYKTLGRLDTQKDFFEVLQGGGLNQGSS